ncbi:MAG TPA: J domain-containing protein [Oculatellaceae cyanobacterium]
MRTYNRDDIARAYNTLDLPLGTSFVEVMLRYRKVAPESHPDRFFEQAEKKRAEDKLKKINHAKDVLHDHFKGPRANHKNDDSCICRPVKSAKGEKTAAEAAKKAAEAAAQKKAEEAAMKAAEAVAKKAAEEALAAAAKKAEQEASRKAKEMAAAAAAEKAAQAKKDAEAADRVARAAAEAAKEATETVHADIEHTQRRLSERERWLAAKVCAAAFLGIMAVTSLADMVKGSSKGQSQLTPGPVQESAADEKKFEQEEKNRLAYDSKHQYDADVNQCLQQISENEKLLQELQSEVERLRQAPANEDTARSIRSLEERQNEAISSWQWASNRLKKLVQDHPQIACDRIRNSPEAPPLRQI